MVERESKAHCLSHLADEKWQVSFSYLFNIVSRIISWQIFVVLPSASAVDWLQPQASSTLRSKGVWTCSFISTVRPTAHTNPSRKQSFSKKRSSNWRNLKTPALRFSVNAKHFVNRAFGERWHHVTSRDFLGRVFLSANPKWLVIGTFSNQSSGIVYYTERLVQTLSCPKKRLSRLDRSLFIP